MAKRKPKRAPLALVFGWLGGTSQNAESVISKIRREHTAEWQAEMAETLKACLL
jgi:hypothetical protein